VPVGYLGAVTELPEASPDPQVRHLLEVLNGDGSRRLSDLSPREARRRLAELPDIGPREAPLDRVEDRTVVAEDGREVPVRLYASSRGHGLPVLVYLHGGGWVTGGLDVHDYRCRRLAARAGCLLVAVDYRLAPEHPFPAAAEDAHAVLRWALSDADAAGGDESRVAIAGDSSGANLAAAATLMARDRGEGAPVFQLLVCPVTECEFESTSMLAYGDGYLMERDDLRWCWDHYLARPGDAESPYASPLRAASLEGLPPALVITAELDPLRDQGEAYARRLEEAGVPVTLARFPGMVHSFVDFEGTLDAAAEALDRSAGALRSAWADATDRGEAVAAAEPLEGPAKRAGRLGDRLPGGS
jgi:acetyl esterase